MIASLPKVSVLMLTYNQVNYIDEAIRSVMLQECDFSFELVIGNDASTDETFARCESWKLRFPDRIVLLNNPKNLGLAGNFVETYRHLRGEYVAICEGDDWWCCSHKLQRQVDWMDEHLDFSCCFHRVVNYYQNRGTKSLSNGGQAVDTTILDLAQRNYISNVSALFRRGLFGELPEWMNKVSTYDLAIHLLNAAHGPLHYMKAPMAVYRQHSAAIWSRTGQEKRWEISIQVRKRLIAHFAKSRPDVSALLEAHIQRIKAERECFFAAQREGRNWSAGGRKTVFQYMLSKARALVSYFMPVPRI